jgi:hypothetical protein
MRMGRLRRRSHGRWEGFMRWAQWAAVVYPGPDWHLWTFGKHTLRSRRRSPKQEQGEG